MDNFKIKLCIAVFAFAAIAANADSLFDFQMKLAQKGNKEAQFKIGLMYEAGLGVNKNRGEALNWIRRAAEQGHETAQLKLLYLDLEQNGVTNTNKSSVKRIKDAANTTNEYAQYFLGLMYEQGIGVQKNLRESLDWYTKAAFAGLRDAEKRSVIVRKQLGEIAAEQAAIQAKIDAERREKEKQEAIEEAKREKRLKSVLKQSKEEVLTVPSAYEEDITSGKTTNNALPFANETPEQRKARHEALLKARKERARKRELEYGSDPCSGKSGELLSTCK